MAVVVSFVIHSLSCVFVRVWQCVVPLIWQHLHSPVPILASVHLHWLTRWRGKVAMVLCTGIVVVDYHSLPPGWKMERGAKCLHCSVLPSHTLEGADMQFHCWPYGNHTNCQGEKELMRHKTSHIQLKQVNFCALDIHSFTSFWINCTSYFVLSAYLVTSSQSDYSKCVTCLLVR